MMHPPHGPNYDKIKPEKPHGIKEVPAYLKKIVAGLFKRLAYIVKLVWQAKPQLIFLMFAYSVVSGAIPVVSALIAREIINALVTLTSGEGSFDKVMTLLILQFAVIFASSLINSLYSMIVRISGELVTNHIKLTILEKTKEIDIESFDRPDFYEKLENASREAGSRPVIILQSVFSVVSSLISLGSFIVILAGVSPAAPLLMIAFSVPSAIVSFVYRKKNFEYMRRRSKDRRKMQYYSDLVTNKDMAKEIRIFDLSDTFIDSYKSTFAKYFAGIKRLIYAENAWSVLISLAGAAINCSLFLLIAKMVALGELMIGDYTLYTGSLNSISQSVSGIISTFAMVYEGTLFIDNMISFMSEKYHIMPITDTPLHVKQGAHSIEFKNVSFRYPGAAEDAVKNLSFTINEGETAVLVGLNGAGKTTIIKLITRLYDPRSGEILLDGKDIRLYDLKELYSMYGLIFQDYGKYAFTAGENIMFGDVSRGYDSELVKSSAEHSGADKFINNLPGGYNTPLMRYFEENGAELSIGQWQKLAVSRAFYGKSDFLILDEPTSSLDAIAEQEIFRQFEELRRGKTTIFVSHRLSSATTASKIIVIEKGKLAECGTHRELMQKGGKYCELFTSQAKRYVDGAGAPEHAHEGMPPRGHKAPPEHR